MPCDLTKFDLAEMLRCGQSLRKAMAGATSVEAAAQRACRSLFDELKDADGQTPACELVRVYKTHAYGGLEPDLKVFARQTLESSPPRDEMKCLVLLGTAGRDEAWNDRHRSVGHKAIPLPSREIVERAPMISQLFTELGVPIEHVVAPSPEIVPSLAGKTYGVFHVEHAVGSPFIPAQQDFVVRHSIRSVVGFGGGLANGDLFALVLFCRVPVSVATAERFRSVALEVKSSLFRLSDSQVFADSAA